MCRSDSDASLHRVGQTRVRTCVGNRRAEYTPSPISRISVSMPASQRPGTVFASLHCSAQCAIEETNSCERTSAPEWIVYVETCPREYAPLMRFAKRTHSYQAFRRDTAQPSRRSLVRHIPDTRRSDAGGSARLERRDSEASKTVPERLPSASARIRPRRALGLVAEPMLYRRSIRPSRRRIVRSPRRGRFSTARSGAPSRLRRSGAHRQVPLPDRARLVVRPHI